MKQSSMGQLARKWKLPNSRILYLGPSRVCVLTWWGCSPYPRWTSFWRVNAQLYCINHSSVLLLVYKSMALTCRMAWASTVFLCNKWGKQAQVHSVSAWLEKDKTTLKSLLLIRCFDHCSKVDYVGEKLETVEQTKLWGSHWRLTDFTRKIREGEKSRGTTEGGCCWQIWELVERLVQVSSLCWDVGNQGGEVGVGPDESLGHEGVHKAPLWFQENQGNNENGAWGD